MSGPAPIVWKDDIQTLNVELEFLTPVFGGGYASGEEKAPHHKPHDAYTPVRSSAFRGALRFWWRATSGAWCESIQKMHEREAEIFGSTERHGDVSLWVDGSKLSHASAVKAQGIGVKYGTFPLRPDEHATNDTEGNLHIYKGVFRVHLQYSQQYHDDVFLALSALVQFGGLGGRTTRGFGQIGEAGEKSRLLDRHTILSRINEKKKAKLKDDVPSISTNSKHYTEKANPPNTTSEHALNAALYKLQLFRQGKNVGRRPGQDPKQAKKLGRSYWPEPEAIRKHTNRRARKHQKLPAQVNAFPRADFGLPIIFHFIGGQEPNKTTLLPKGKERMRSPLQISVHRDGYSFLVLTAPRAQELTLKDAPQDPTVRLSLSDPERQALAAQGGASRELFAPPTTGGTYDVLDAFLQFVRNSN